jgi:hypothetical protein
MKPLVNGHSADHVAGKASDHCGGSGALSIRSVAVL